MDPIDPVLPTSSTATSSEPLALVPFARRVAELLEVDLEEPVNPYDHLVDDWGIDSLQVFQVLVIVEALAGALVPPPEVPDLRTVGEAHDYYRALLADAA